LKQRGFTLIEMVMTMVIIGVLAVFVIPNMGSIKAFEVVAYQDKVRSALQFARASAVAERRKVCVQLANHDLALSVDTATPETSTTGCSVASALPRPLDMPSPDRGCNTANKVCHPSGVTLTSTADAISFNPLGQPSAAVTYTVTGQSAVTITVEAETGYVH
jgi:MSHA pilin protein MshC